MIELVTIHKHNPQNFIRFRHLGVEYAKCVVCGVVRRIDNV